MTYGSDSNPTGRSVAWWAFHNVDDVATVFPLGDGQRRQLQATGSLRVTTDEQTSDTDITVPRDLGWLDQIKVVGHEGAKPAKSGDSSVSKGFLYAGLNPSQEDVAYHWAPHTTSTIPMLWPQEWRPRFPYPPRPSWRPGCSPSSRSLWLGHWPGTNAWLKDGLLRTFDASDWRRAGLTA